MKIEMFGCWEPENLDDWVYYGTTIARYVVIAKCERGCHQWRSITSSELIDRHRYLNHYWKLMFNDIMYAFRRTHENAH